LAPKAAAKGSAIASTCRAPTRKAREINALF